MRIFKFGGASVKSAEGIINVAKIIDQHGAMPLLIVVSALGKTTNLIENIIKQKWEHGEASHFEQLTTFHDEIITKLFAEEEDIRLSIQSIYHQLYRNLTEITTDDFDFFYDQTVSYGEILSSTILYHYLKKVGHNCYWIDSRNIISTDETFRQANVDFVKTARNVNKEVLPKITPDRMVITQGFIGGKHNNVTTLGREGSDYSAAIYASLLNAKSMTVWKDVPGVLNADPRFFENPVKIEVMNYQEAAELTYYGASVLHPKTIRPLAESGIPLEVRSFENPELKGTIIDSNGDMHHLESKILLQNQCLMTFRMKNFSFIQEEALSKLFLVLHELNIKLNLMQNSALSFSICFDYSEQNVEEIMVNLQSDFNILFNNELQLLTIKNFKEQSVETAILEKEIYLEQRSRSTFQIVYKW